MQLLHIAYICVYIRTMSMLYICIIVASVAQLVRLTLVYRTSCFTGSISTKGSSISSKVHDSFGTCVTLHFQYHVFQYHVFTHF